MEGNTHTHTHTHTHTYDCTLLNQANLDKLSCKNKTSATCQHGESVSESDDDINVQLTLQKLNFLAEVEIQRYQDTRRVEKQRYVESRMETMEHESDKDAEMGIRNAIDEKKIRKLAVKGQRIRNTADGTALRKESVKVKRKNHLS